MYNNTVTVFNYYESTLTGEGRWYPHVITGCDLIVDKASNQAKTGLENADVAKLHVRFMSFGRDIFVGKEPYLTPKKWAEQTNDMLAKTITFSEGTDFFVEGAYDTTPINDNQYRGGFYNFMNKNMDDVYLIKSVGKYSVIPHFEISGA